MTILRAPVLVAVALLGALLVSAPGSSATSPASERSAASAAARTRVIADCAHRSIKPHHVVVTCADAGVYAVVKSYGSWRATAALGQGRLHLNDCEPSCADGTFHSFPATFRFHRVVHTSHGPLFTRLGVTYVRGGEQRNAQYSLPRRPL
ncbi:hypothetical protein [Nocardioides sp.]|uniref:hypothetical protein n=1 Tax=Nocardioides sp. TaxID=35761 RepID=UPI003784F53D